MFRNLQSDVAMSPSSFDLGSKPTLNLRANCQGFWKLDDLTDSVSDSDFTNVNGVTFVSGKIGNAAHFDSSLSQKLEISDATLFRPGDSSFTIGVWAKLASTSGTILGKGGDLNEQEYKIDLILTKGFGVRWVFTVVASDGFAATQIHAFSASSPTIGSWNYLLVWHNAESNTINIRVNNGTIDSASHSTGIFASEHPFTLGKGTVGEYLSGDFDSVGYWSAVLSAQQQAALYNGGIGFDPF